MLKKLELLNFKRLSNIWQQFPYVSNEILDWKNQLSCMSYIPLLFTPFFICFKCHAWFEKPAFSHILYSVFIYSIFHMFQMTSLIWKTSFSAYPIFHFYLLCFPHVSNGILDLKNQLFFHILYSIFIYSFPFWKLADELTTPIELLGKVHQLWIEC